LGTVRAFMSATVANDSVPKNANPSARKYQSVCIANHPL
jgi:hypothetical protein